jgi:hypothetical protein
MPATKEQMFADFQTVYGADWAKKQLPDKLYINDLATIGTFLHPDSELFLKALQKLDEEMLKLFEARTLQTFPKSRIAPKSVSSFSHGRNVVHTTKIKKEDLVTDTGKDATKHLLTEVLAKFEKAEGFADVDEQTGKCVCFYNNLGNDEFAGAIKTKHLAKDYVGDLHGTYTHRIQWYLAGIMKNDLGLKSTSISTLFGLSGRTWGLVFDRNANDKIRLINDDFRRPELMNPWIANNHRRGNYSWPILSAFLKSRLERLPRGWAPDILKLNLARKMYGVTPSSNYRSNSKEGNTQELQRLLTSEQVDEVTRAINGATYDPQKNGIVSFASKSQ